MNVIAKFFKFKERQTSLKRELIGGIVTFVAMLYILPVNASLLSMMGMNESGVFFSTALVSFISCMLMGLIGNLPLAVSAGMGMNAYLTYTICMQMGFTWVESMLLLTINGVIFIILTLQKKR